MVRIARGSIWVGETNWGPYKVQVIRARGSLVIYKVLNAPSWHPNQHATDRASFLGHFKMEVVP